ncbi:MULTISPECIES: hypothetical protein [Streptomyces]|uniref:hypothetical protein n=1 Tax=Streptomyces TaxID=1883 RepID=UPI000765E6A1|nr:MULTISPECIES: hypothetical protein [Streptomyces]MDX3840064.1 hypothetical protein [Streptomyces europaeiscabiei]
MEEQILKAIIELRADMDKRFTAMDDRFTAVDTQLDGQDEQFTRLYQHMQTEFKRVNDRLDDTPTRQNLDHVAEMVDGIAKVVEEDQSERAALAQQVGRVEDDVQALQKHLGLAQS